MRILVDRHHADLLYAIQRLFEDRLGIEVFIPVGHEWWDSGYWRFGQCFGDDRLAQQYLNIADGVTFPVEEEGCYVTYDSSHPERPIRCVTLDQFRALGDWAFTMPTVQENQYGFHRLAQEYGARYLYQIGNTGQQLDWGLDPLVINTSEHPIPEGKGVTIHQELDSGPGGAFGWRPSTEPRIVRNFVNAFNRLPGYSAFLDSEAALRQIGWEFTVHGHEGRNGNINPVEAMGNMMADSGWGWHDKPVGDGFGHVIHSWASVGRPLVGHAAYYDGKQAAPFWRDGETCFDIGARSLAETLKLMVEVVEAPERHAEMCAAIRAEFDRQVDYEAEADAVRALLRL